METKKKQIAIWMTAEELERLELVKEHLNRKTNSDTLRVLVDEAAKKFLPANTAMALLAADSNTQQGGN